MTPEILLEIAQHALEAGQKELARRYLNNAVALDPNCVAAIVGLVRLECEEGRFASAVTILATQWQATRNAAFGDLLAELAAIIAQNAEQGQIDNRKVLSRIADMLKALHGPNGILIDTLEYDIIGGLALDAVALIPRYKAGFIGRNGKPVVFFSGKSANPALVDMIAREIPTFTDPTFPRLFSYTTYDWSNAVYTVNQQFFHDFFGRHADLFKGLVEFTHSTNGRTFCTSREEHDHCLSVKRPTISFNHDELEKGERFLRKILNLSEDGWFVCVYARDAAYYNETPQSPNWFRNSDIHTFLPAIDMILAQGGHVVRIGECTCESLRHPDPRVFDYSNSVLREPLLDIYLLAHCRFLLGTPSGLCHVANIFNTPQLMVNSVSVCTLSSCELYIPKKIRDTRTNMLLPFAEFLERYYGYGDVGLFSENGINQENLLHVRYEDNSPEEIAAAAVEMMNRLSGMHIERPDITFVRNRFKETWLRMNPAMPETPVASFFLDIHQDLFV